MTIGLTPSWKLFRIACIIQLVLVAVQLVLGISGIFYRSQVIYPITEAVCYGLIFVFVYMGLSILNYNYPDTPLSNAQRRNFNWLFLLNFLLIAYLFGQLVTEVKYVFPWLPYVTGGLIMYLRFISTLLLDLFIFLLHLVFLVGMYQLRRAIYTNTTKSWIEQFDEENK